MAWYNEIQPDWTEEGTQGMAMMDALKLMSALKGSEIEQLERQTNMLKLLGVLGGEQKPIGARVKDALLADAGVGNLDALSRLSNIAKAERGEWSPSTASGASWVDKQKELEALNAIAPQESRLWWPLAPIFGAPIRSVEQQKEAAMAKSMGAGLIPAKSAAQMWGMPKYPGGPRDEQYNPLEGTDIGRQETNPIVAQLLQRLLAISGR